jgi:hypothetical protein
MHVAVEDHPDILAPFPVSTYRLATPSPLWVARRRDSRDVWPPRPALDELADALGGPSGAPGDLTPGEMEHHVPRRTEEHVALAVPLELRTRAAVVIPAVAF